MTFHIIFHHKCQIEDGVGERQQTRKHLTSIYYKYHMFHLLLLQFREQKPRKIVTKRLLQLPMQT
jgi:hypothetical protein